jgi:Casjensviridae DNA primase
MAGYLSEKIDAVLGNGFEPIPIKPGTKRPDLGNWERLDITRAVTGAWKRNGRADYGIGIRTRHTPLIDIDVQHKATADRMHGAAIERIGPAPCRIGLAPKRGLLYRCDEPFRKIASNTYVDPNGHDARIEILGDGQQFVAYAIHPDTGKPYRWTDPTLAPENAPADMLTTLDPEGARWLCDLFNADCEAQGWEKKAPPLATLPTRKRTTVRDDEWGLHRERCYLSDEEIIAKVMSIPNVGIEYEDGELNWRNMMMAIHHETKGSEFGRSVAYEWSIQNTTKHSGQDSEDEFDKTWRSFSETPKGRDPVTFRYVLRFATAVKKAEAVASLEDILHRMSFSTSIEELTAIATEAKRLQVEPVQHAQLVNALRKNAESLGLKLTSAQAKEILRYEPAEIPDWLRGWVYLSHADRFLNMNTGEFLTERSFNSKHKQFVGDIMPADVALKQVKIRVCYMNGYLPGADPFFTLNGFEYANTFSRRNYPKVPEKLEGEDRENVRRVFQHFKALFPDEREHQIAISWFAHIVQTETRPNWAIIMQGAEGDGRSFFGQMMAAVLGGDNTKPVDAKTFESTFNAWAAGSLFTTIEEVRLVGHNRHDILNSIKPLITNATIQIHPKGIDPYTALNTAGYLLTTNYQNALPINSNDRRYFVLMSQHQTAEAVTAAFPDPYFDDLWATLTQSPGAIRGWLLKYRLHEEFKPKGRAPDTRAKQQMIDFSKTDDTVLVEDLIEAGQYPEISNDLIVISKLAEVLSEQNAPYKIKETTVAAILRQLGFQHVGRVRLVGLKNKSAIWSKNPGQWLDRGIPATGRIRWKLENPL